jgi:benzoyl-CoA reductase/2-hydroxyglutaryl-CoA dehydratase subunit BcrC/BadD/HgdB
MKQKIDKIFDDFLNDANSPFIKLEFRDENSFVKKRINKATTSRGNIRYLQERVLEVIKEHEPLDEIFTGTKENKLRNKIKELNSINEHLRKIYKRDLKKNAPVSNSASQVSKADGFNKGYEVNQK